MIVRSSFYVKRGGSATLPRSVGMVKNEVALLLLLRHVGFARCAEHRASYTIYVWRLLQ